MAILLLSSSQVFASVERHIEPEEEASTKNVVFVIDVSNSMYDIIDDLKKALKDYVQESSVGDSVSLVTFGNSAKLHYRKTIDDFNDFTQILEFCDSLSCPDDFTYLPCGLKKGIEELYQLHLMNPSSESILVLMSDGVNHPPESIEDESLITYDSILKQFSPSFAPGTQWFITYVALKGKPDAGLFDFVKTCRGGTIKLGGKLQGGISEVKIRHDVSMAEESTLELGTACLPLKTTIPLLLKPVRGKPAGQRIQIEGMLIDDPLSRHITLQVSPNEIICPKNEIRIDMEIAIEGKWDGAIQGVLNFIPPEGSLLIIHPSHFLLRAKKPIKILIGRLDPATGTYEWGKAFLLSLGPLRAGDTVEEKFALKLEGLQPFEDIQLNIIPKIELPPGVECRAEIDISRLRKEGMTEAVVRAFAQKETILSNGREWNGELTLRTSSPEFILPKEPLGLQIRAAVLNHSFHWKKWLLILLASVLITGTVGGAKVLSDKKFVPAEGTLLVLECPQSLQLEYIDLKQISEKTRRKRLTIGSDKSSDISIRHKSVNEHHARLKIARRMGGTHLLLKSLGANTVYLNKTPLKKETRITDRDVIQIGEFQFLYCNSPLKQVVVHYKDGSVKYGIPLTWNIEEKGFLLQTEKEAGGTPTYVSFVDLKAVFFVKHFDKEIARKMKFSSFFAQKDHLRVLFKDGEKMDGYTIKDYDPKAERFFLVPQSATDKEENNICVLVERIFTNKIKVLKDAEPNAPASRSN